jgi:DNA methylase
MNAVINQVHGEVYSLYQGDSAEVLRGLPDNSIGMTLFSPPFMGLYVYSDSIRDLGNSKTDAEFWAHFGFIADELFRIMKPGRILAFHCMVMPAMKERDGYIGLKDFRGEMIRFFEKRGFIHHSEHVIWKDPLIEATRTKALGLMHKQLMKDSAMCRAGLPDYLIAMRKPGENSDPICHPDGLDHWAGTNPPKNGNLSHERWRRYADPIWDDINQSRTLNARDGRSEDDSRHIAPLQLDVIDRAVWLWSNKGDTVCSPFAGIGSEGYVALLKERRFVGIELKAEYFNQAAVNLDAAVEQRTQGTLGFARA